MRSTQETAENLAVVGATREFETMFSAIIGALSFKFVGTGFPQAEMSAAKKIAASKLKTFVFTILFYVSSFESDFSLFRESSEIAY